MALAGCFALSACGFLSDGEPMARQEVVEDAEPATELSARTLSQIDEAPQDCLFLVWESHSDSDREFDMAHDNVTGGAISCATGTSPSAYQATLDAIREAASSGDRLAIVEETDIPLLYIDDAGSRLDMSDEQEISQRFDEIFTPDMLAVMQDLKLEDMTVVPDQGGYFALGAIWLVAREEGGRPRLVTVNRQAFREAQAAMADVRTEQPEIARQ